ncbi:MAG TPA: ABC transporter permease [Bacteroidales bacterium]|nr:ABC transporter permease [Bacteroidales bacterium]
MYLLYLKIWWRRTKKKILISLLNYLTYSLGFAVAFLLLLFVYNERSYNKSFPNYENIYRVLAEDSDFKTRTPLTSYGLSKTIEDEIPGVISTRTINPGRIDILKEDNTIAEYGFMAVDLSFFRIFSLVSVYGSRSELLFKNPDNIIITRSFARKYFNKENAVGETLKIKRNRSEIHFSVIGVIEDLPKNCTIKGNAFFNLEQSFNSILNGGSEDKDSWESKYFVTYLILKENTKPKETEKQLNLIAKKYDTQFTRYSLQPVSEIYLNSADLINDYTIKGDRKKVLTLFMGAIFILFINILNFIILSMAGVMGRNREVGLNKLFGASRGSFVKQFFTETLINVSIALTVLFALMEVITIYYKQLFSSEIVISFSAGVQFCLFFIVLLLLINTIPGLYISHYLTKVSPLSALSGVLSSSQGKFFLRRGMMYLQLFIFSILIIYTIVVNKQLSYAMNFHPGFNKENLFIIRGDILNENKISYSAFKSEISQLPYVEDVSGALYFPPIPQGGVFQIYTFPEDPDRKVNLELIPSDVNIVKTLGLGLVTGRDFCDGIDSDNSNSILLTESAVAALSIKDAIGKSLDLANNNYKIVGIVNDFFVHSVHAIQNPIGLVCRPSQVLDIGIRLKPGLEKTQLDEIIQKYKTVFKVENVAADFFDDQLRMFSENEYQWSRLVYVFTLLSIAMISLGLIGLSFFILDNRTKEIAVRKVFGSNPAQTIWLVYREFFFLSFAAMFTAIPVAYYLSVKWLQSFPRHISIGWGIFILSLGLLLTFIAICVSYKGIKVLKTNPSVTLKYE